MRILDHKQYKKSVKQHKRRPSYKFIVILIAIIISVMGALYIYSDRYSEPAAIQTPVPEFNQPESDPFDITERPLKKLTGDQFKELFLSVSYPNTQEIQDPPAITGNPQADERIRTRAEARGYRLSLIPMGAILKIENEPRLDNDDLLQPLAADAWYKLKDEARREGRPISLLSAYRSPNYQQELFMERLLSSGVTIEQIASGSADTAIDITLEITAVPGYSRHHTGYTIDLWCEDGSSAFLESSCYEWISANNYQKAMEFGWIPSYPEGATEQGPEPEPWEYVWVGNAVRQ